MVEQQPLIAVVRRPDALQTLSSKRVNQSIAIVSGPVSDKRLLESWHALGQVQAANEKTLYHVLVVLLETTPDLTAEAPLGPLPDEWSTPAAKPKATSAHPRAYKGTKYQPPKARRLAPIDLRPYLCEAKEFQRMIGPLKPFIGQALARLARDGYTEEQLAGVEVECFAKPGRRCWSLPAHFVAHLWPLVRWQSPDLLSRWLRLYTDLGLDTDKPALALLTRLLAMRDKRAVTAWCEMADALPEERRSVLFRTLVLAGREMPTLSQRVAEQIAETNELCTDEQFAKWIPPLLEKVLKGEATEYLMAGFRLATAFQPGYSFEEIGECSDFPEEIVREIGEHLHRSDNGRWRTMGLWTKCGKVKAFSSILRKARWRDLAPENLAAYLDIFGIWENEISGQALQKKWQSIGDEVPALDNLLNTIPVEYQRKAIALIEDWFSGWDDPRQIKRQMKAGLLLARRVACPPLSEGAQAALSLSALLEIRDEQLFQRVLNTPDQHFLILERVCQRTNKGSLIGRGLWALFGELDDLAAKAFAHALGKLLKTAESLGCLGYLFRRQVLRECREHVLFRDRPLTDMSELEFKDYCREISNQVGVKFVNPIPARLKAWCKGDISLTAGSLERHKRVVGEKLLLTRLDVIEKDVLRHLQKGLPAKPATKEEHYALRLAGDVRENRRGLRKFLKAWWQGDREYLAQHPATIDWCKKHGKISLAVWENGIAFQPHSGDFKIEIEKNPFEILKLGAYAGTCLAVGGICSDSSVAALLDVNKKVLYARDMGRRVIGRQLVAIDEDDQLVCFHVYPRSTPTEIKRAFRDYDQAFAEALGIPLYKSEEEKPSYRVSSVLSKYWWDDGDWDFEVERRGVAKRQLMA